jgi:hypothetical protein
MISKEEYFKALKIVSKFKEENIKEYKDANAKEKLVDYKNYETIISKDTKLINANIDVRSLNRLSKFLNIPYNEIRLKDLENTYIGELKLIKGFGAICCKKLQNVLLDVGIILKDILDVDQRTLISECNISQRLKNCLNELIEFDYLKVNSFKEIKLGHFKNVSKKEITQLRMFGKKSIDELEDLLKRANIIMLK